MYELGSDLRREQEKLLRRAKQVRKYQIPTLLAVFSGISLTLILPLSIPVQEVGFFPSRFLLFIGPLMMGLFVGATLSRFAIPYMLSLEESLFLKVCSVIEDLGAYIEDEREPDRKSAEKKIEKILSEIEKWYIGDIKLCANVIGSRLEAFKEAFYRKVISSVRQREKPDLINAYFILRGFAKYLLESEQKIEDIERMTKAMNEMIKVTAPSGPSAPKTILGLKVNTLLLHIGLLTLIMVCGVTPAILGIYYGNISLENAFLVFAAIFGPLIAVYLSYVLRIILKKESRTT